MRLLRRYFLMQFLKLYAVTSVGLALTISLMDLLSSLGGFMPFSPPLGGLIKYAALRAPNFYLYVMPMAALLCGIFTVSSAARARELVVVMAAGGRLKALFIPFIITGLMLSVMGFVIGEFGVPDASRAARVLKDTLKHRKTKSALFKNGTMWIRAQDGSLVKIDLYAEGTGAFKGLSIFRLSEGGIDEVVMADEAVYGGEGEQGGWLLKGVRKLDPATGKETRMSEMRYPYLGSPAVLNESARESNEMGIVELHTYLRRLEEAGFKNQRLTVDLHAKFSYPLICLFMVTLGVSFSAGRNMKGMAATAIGILISLVYLFGHSMMVSLGYAGIIPPIVAAWAVPAIFGVAAAYLFSRIPE